MSKWSQALVWALPSGRVKNALLRRAGHTLGTGVRVGPCLVVGVGRVSLGDNVVIRTGNVIRDITELAMADESGIGSWNWISAHPAYRSISAGAGTLQLDRCARIESRNYIDCSGTVEIGAYAAVGGNRCMLQTHEADLSRMVQTVGRIVVGHHSSIASSCVLLQGAVLPPSSALAAHSTLTGRVLDDPRPGLYAGSPAVFKKPLSGGWFERTENAIVVMEVKGALGLRRDRAVGDGG